MKPPANAPHKAAYLRFSKNSRYIGRHVPEDCVHRGGPTPTPVTNDGSPVRGRNCEDTSVRAAARFFSGVPHPHLLGVCGPNASSPRPLFSREEDFSREAAKCAKVESKNRAYFPFLFISPSPSPLHPFLLFLFATFATSRAKISHQSPIHSHPRSKIPRPFPCPFIAVRG